MQKVIYTKQIQEYSDYIDQSVIDYIASGQIETFESFPDYNIIAFDWYDPENADAAPAQLMIYIDADDLFFICENDDSYRVAHGLFVEAESNERALYLFFCSLFKSGSIHLERMEDRISRLDDAVIEERKGDLRAEIVELRYEVMRLRKYYEQMDLLFDEMCENENELFSKEYLKYFAILHSRVLRLISMVQSLRDYITQVRESYQAQIGIKQNNLMKVFTLVTSIFLPLTLIVGWYGMNFDMPEFRMRYGYPMVIGLCAVVCIVWYIAFKRKNWFK